MQELVWAMFGAAIGTAANLCATRSRHRALGIDVAAGIAAALGAGASFTFLGATSVHAISVFGADPVGFYALLSAAAGAIAFFIALDAFTELRSGSRRHAVVPFAGQFSGVAHGSRSFLRNVGLIVRSRDPAPALAKSRTR